MQPFKIIEASDNAATIQVLSTNNNVKLIGGGTNLVDLMKMYVETPAQLIDINNLDLKKIEILPNGNVLIGALVRNSDLAYDTTISTKYPVLSQALLSGASAQLRNMATVGGNLMQRTRCPYFFNTSFPCNKRQPGTGCPAIKGYNRSHAVLGTSDQCIATHPSDMCVALTALDAVIHLQGNNGKRTIKINEFYLLPGTSPDKETVLLKDELITGVEIPAIPYAVTSQYLKVRDRASYEFALSSAAVVLDIINNTIQSAHIALGGIGTIPWRAAEAEKVLTGAKISKDIFRLAADAALKDAKPYQYNSFKIELSKRTLIRVLENIGGIS